MTALQCRFLAFAWVASVAFGDGHVQTLMSGNFKAFVENTDLSLVKFYAPWCGHCRAMVPAYEEAARRLVVHSITLGKVDCTEETALAEQNGISGYPTLKVFRRGVGVEYTGPRDAEGIVTAMLAERVATPGLGAGSLSEQAQQGTAFISDAESPLLMAKLCRDHTCQDHAFPIMEYVEETKKCGCIPHPCWNDNGQVHSCNDPKHPHLAFNYDKDGKLSCGCKAEAHFMNKYIGQVKCPGHSCETPTAAILDFVPAENKCVCRANPCDSIMGGVTHSCTDPKHPTLSYREESAPDGRVKQVCECKARFQHKGHDEL